MFGLFKRKQSVLETPARHLYEAMVLRAREPIFYTDFSVQDTVEGRFDAITLHVCLLLRRLKDGADVTEELSQGLFDLMFLDMETNLRELGVGDVGLPKRMKKLIKAFYGRLKAYDEGLDLGLNGDLNPLIAALNRNLYGDIPTDPQQVSAMAEYMLEVTRDLQNQALPDLQVGNVTLAALPKIKAVS